MTASASALAKARKALRVRPIHMTVMRMVNPDTGELIGCLVPTHPVDQRSMKENRYAVGAELRGTFRRARNVGFWRKAHVLGGWLADHVEGFEGLGQHAAVKRLQELSGVGCLVETFDLPAPLGRVTRAVADSLNFDDMDETEFQALWDGWLNWLRMEKWPALDRLSIEEVEELVRAPWEQA